MLCQVDNVSQCSINLAKSELIREILPRRFQLNKNATDSYADDGVNSAADVVTLGQRCSILLLLAQL